MTQSHNNELNNVSLNMFVYGEYYCIGFSFYLLKKMNCCVFIILLILHRHCAAPRKELPKRAALTSNKDTLTLQF